MSSQAAGQRSWLSRWTAGIIPLEIADDLRHAQLDSLVEQVPVLLAVASLNTVILMAVCAWQGLPLAHYGWMGGLVLYGLVRRRIVKRRFTAAVTADQQRSLVRTSTIAAISMLAFLGVTAAATYAAGLLDHSLLIPMSLGFGSIAIAHCLYRLYRVAIASLVLGIGPSSVMLMWVGDFEAKMLGVSMISVGLLMMRFVSAQYRQLIDNLRLHRHIQTMANSDALTGLANRRAVDEFLARQTGNDRLAVALIDLDGFKQVNDIHGHAAGDALLAIVGERLTAAFAGPGLVGRLGGDEFIAILTEAGDDADLDAAATGLLAALCRPVAIGSLQLPLAASLGHARQRGAEDRLADVLKRADEALYAAKRLRARDVAPARPKQVA
jgi:diguanylate cyclase